MTKRIGLLCLWIAVFLLAAVGVSYAQTAPAVPALGQYQFSAGYASISGPTDNGAHLGFAKQIGSREWLQAKDYMLSNPSGVNIFSVGPRFRPPLSAIWKTSGYLDTSKWYPFVDLDLGVVKDPNGKMSFAYGIGAGLDYQASSTVTLLVVQGDYYRSNYFPGGGIFVGNVKQVTSVVTGLKVTF